MSAQIIAWINFFILLMSSLLFLLFYGISVSPAALSRVIGTQAYQRCGVYRKIAISFELVTLINFGLYKAYPIKSPIPTQFAFSSWLSTGIGLIIGLPAMGLMVKGLLDAGSEAIAPQESQTLYGGIYNHIRHPQALGEMFLWTIAAFLLNSPFLVLISVIYYPIFLITMWMEEHDLILRFGQEYVEMIKRTGFIFPKRKSDN